MIAGLDSMNPPSAAQARAAAAGGYRKWSGYLATQSNVGLARAWTQAEFENARFCGSTPIAYCSGWDDPVALKALASAWNLLLCLDNEGGIRPDGGWAQSFLDVSGAGVYGNAPVHRLRAAFHVLAAYPSSGDPSGASWNYTARPAGPCGWQWAGTHTEFGIGVDSTWFDDWFGGLHGGGSGGLGGFFLSLTPAEERQVVDQLNSLYIEMFGSAGAVRTPPLQDKVASIYDTLLGGDTNVQAKPMQDRLKEIQDAVNALVPASGPTVDLSPVLKAIAAVQAKLDKDLA